MYKWYGGLIVGQRFEPAGFAAPLGHKDIRLTLAAAVTLRVPMPFASVLHDRVLTLLALGEQRQEPVVQHARERHGHAQRFRRREGEAGVLLFQTGPEPPRARTLLAHEPQSGEG